MNPLSLSTLATMSGASLLTGNPEICALRVSKDTRTIQSGDLYIALRGEHFDGNDYLEEAASRGAVGALCDREVSAGLPHGFGVLSTPDVPTGLILLASAWRSHLALRTVVITGSSGKTSTKDFTAAVMKSRFRTTATAGNFNNHIGLPLSILAANTEDEVAVWEIGMNHRGEIAPLAGLSRPEIGIITGIGVTHIEYLKSKEEIAREKGDLLERLPSSGTAIIPAYDDFATQLRARTSARVLEVGFDAGNIRATGIVAELTGSHFLIEGDFGKQEVFLPVTGRHMVGNALLAVAAGVLMGIPLSLCATALSSSELTGGRLGRVMRRGVLLLDDTYNANPDSMVAALETLASLPGQGKKIGVLGKMGELGIHAAAGYERVGGTASRLLDTLICIGSEAAAIATAATTGGLRDVRVVSNNSEAAKMLSSLAHAGDFVLLKASRSAHMEEVIHHFN
jgi:UDP-N-acetylmuramoyl-tripeptide--D-alanyl-D-alanine ligase